MTQDPEASSSRSRCSTDKRADFPWTQLWLTLRTKYRSQDPNIPAELQVVDDCTEFYSFLAYCLGHDFFEYPKNDALKEEILNIVVLMSRGVTFPLDPMFLGGLYHHLDVLVSDLRWANAENFTVESFVPTAFLQVWMWEKFRECRPKVKPLVLDNGELKDRGRSRQVRAPVSHHRM
ncbi:hypothetical protein MKX01_028916 [Papaver californicum]|nr:hypothetical protein MKX01_028916 [Papaver californicum]